MRGVQTLSLIGGFLLACSALAQQPVAQPAGVGGGAGGDDKPVVIPQENWERIAPPIGPAQPIGDNPKRPYTIMVGDDAPFLKFSDYLLGEPVTAWEKGKIYVLFPFALFCDPCLEELPTLTRLQNEFSGQDVTIIGVTSPSPTHTEESVRKYIFETMADKIGFHVAWDRPRRFFDDLLYPSGRSSIPTVAIIDRDGKLAYLGGPEFYEKTLRQIASGTFDLEAATRTYFNEIQVGWGYAHFEKFLREKNFGDAYAVGRQIVFDRGADVYFANANVAWAIVDPQNPPAQTDLDLALAAAARAYGISEGKVAIANETLARVHFVRGELMEAVRFQREAVNVSKSDKQRQQLQATLKEYEVAYAQQRSGAPPETPAAPAGKP
jgi:thiol-disulfide isomerase/thioredoxin